MEKSRTTFSPSALSATRPRDARRPLSPSTTAVNEADRGRATERPDAPASCRAHRVPRHLSSPVRQRPPVPRIQLTEPVFGLENTFLAAEQVGWRLSPENYGARVGPMAMPRPHQSYRPAASQPPSAPSSLGSSPSAVSTGSPRSLGSIGSIGSVGSVGSGESAQRSPATVNRRSGLHPLTRQGQGRPGSQRAALRLPASPEERGRSMARGRASARPIATAYVSAPGLFSYDVDGSQDRRSLTAHETLALRMAVAPLRAACPGPQLSPPDGQSPA